MSNIFTGTWAEFVNGFNNPVYNTLLIKSEDNIDASLLKSDTANTIIDALPDYSVITLNEDVITDETIINMYDGTINGNGYSITYTGDNALFDDFRGNMINVAINGNIANKDTGIYANVANWNNALGKYYNKAGECTLYNNLGELGFAIRDEFGADLTNHILSKIDPYTIVHNITIYEPDKEVQYYINNDPMPNVYITEEGRIVVPPNTFIKTETVELGDEANIIYNDICKTVEITDKKAFYCPYDIHAGRILYNREFNIGECASVILPFDIDINDQNIQLYLFNYFNNDTNKFMFKIVNHVDANTPCFINIHSTYNGETNLFGELYNIDIKATPKEQIIETDAINDEQYKCLGLYKSTKEIELNPDRLYKIYGIRAATGNFLAAASTAAFSPFRTLLKEILN